MGSSLAALKLSPPSGWRELAADESMHAGGGGRRAAQPAGHDLPAQPLSPRDSKVQQKEKGKTGAERAQGSPRKTSNLPA